MKHNKNIIRAMLSLLSHKHRQLHHGDVMITSDEDEKKIQSRKGQKCETHKVVKQLSQILSQKPKFSSVCKKLCVE